MENASEALKIAFGVMMFVLALTLSITSFSQATQAVETITYMSDRETTYTYVKPASNSNRIVGVETVIPTMYNAYKENYKVYFYESYTDENNNKPLYLYKYVDPNKPGGILQETKVYYIDLEKEIFPSAADAVEHLNILLGKRPTDTNSKYYEQFIHSEGLYEFLKNYKFEEILGEYYQEDALDAEKGTTSGILDINKTKKRIITYVVHN